MISPCIDILHHLAKKVYNELGSHQDVKHTSPTLVRDINHLMQSLADHAICEVEPSCTITPDEGDEGEAELRVTGIVCNTISKGLN